MTEPGASITYGGGAGGGGFSVWQNADHESFASVLAELPEYRCSMARQVTVVVGSLATCAALGVLVATVAYRTFIERR